MKKYSLLILFLSSTFIFAQSNYQDVVYLKNGSIIRGSIIEQIPNKTIKIETADQRVFVFQTKEIEKLTKELNQDKKQKKHAENTGLPEYKAIIELGAFLSFNHYNYIKLNTSYHYPLSPYYSIGLGTGFRHSEDFSAIPVYVNFRSRFSNNNYAPYFSLGLGGWFNPNYNKFEVSGLMFDPSAGVVFRIAEKSAMNVGLNYELLKNSDYISGFPSIVVGILL